MYKKFLICSLLLSSCALSSENLRDGSLPGTGNWTGSFTLKNQLVVNHKNENSISVSPYGGVEDDGHPAFFMSAGPNHETVLVTAKMTPSQFKDALEKVSEIIWVYPPELGEYLGLPYLAITLCESSESVSDIFVEDQ